MTPTDGNQEEATARVNALVSELDRLGGAGCTTCGQRLCGHHVLFSVALGLKNAPRCLRCLAEGMGGTARDLGEQLIQYVQHRDCYRQAWDVASDRERLGRGPRPACLGLETTPPAAAAAVPASPAEARPDDLLVAATWDAGDMGCGDLVLALRGRLNDLPAGAVLEVTARDPAAPEDLPAWCRLTGHRLAWAGHPRYLIRRKET